MMRVSSLRVLLLVAAMVLQAVAGGFGAARAMGATASSGLSAHCASLRSDHAPSDHAPSDHAPADHAPADHGPGCGHCCLSGDPPTAALDGGRATLAAPAVSRAPVMRPGEIGVVSGRAAQSPFARGPPPAKAA